MADIPKEIAERCAKEGGHIEADEDGGDWIVDGKVRASWTTGK